MIDLEEPTHPVERIGWSLVFLAVLSTGLNSWGDWSTWPGLGVVTPLVVLVGLVGCVAAWTGFDLTDPRARAAGLGVALVTVIATNGADIAARPFYDTDSAAFNDVATRMLLHGHNPYTASLSGASSLLRQASAYWTYLLNGGHVTQVSYPAGAFLLQAPLAALGVHHLTTDWLDLAAWVVTAVILFRALPGRLRWLAPLVFLAPSFSLDFTNGGTDALFLPFLALAVWRWDRVVAVDATRLERWLGPVALGLACSVKQSPWFCVPFLVLAVALEARAVRVPVARAAARYAGIVLGAFTLVNLPFIVWDPSAWWHGTMLPLLSPLVPDGQGLVTLALHGATGGVDLTELWLCATLVMVTLLVALALWYPQLKRAWLFLVPLVLFVPGRSLSNYLLDFFPVAIIAAVSVARRDPETASAPRPGARAAMLAVPLAAAMALGALALTSAPLAVRVVRLDTTAGHAAFDSVTVDVRNDASRAVTPHFMITIEGGHPTGFWSTTVRSGSFPLAPGATATVVLRPVNFTWAPPFHQYWLVSAYSASPAAVSTSSPQRWLYGGN